MNLRKSLGILLVVFVAGLALSRVTDAPVFSAASNKEKIPVLMYHKVSPYYYHGGPGLRITPDFFEEQVRYLKERGYHTVSLDQLIDFWDKKAALPSKPIVLTFDDGYEDNYRFVFPILKKYRYTATIFLVYNDIGGYNAWDSKNNLVQRIRLLSWVEIRAMQKSGISFQSHTLNHPDLTALNPIDAEKEVRESKAKLEKALGKPVCFIAYPYGRRNPVVDDVVAKAGYKAALTTIMGKNTIGTDRFILRRLRVNGYLNMNRFKKMVEE
ncbi:MAG: polysaccharide deacetylase family protein [Eubacteriales bacterium]